VRERVLQVLVPFAVGLLDLQAEAVHHQFLARLALGTEEVPVAGV